MDDLDPLANRKVVLDPTPTDALWLVVSGRFLADRKASRPSERPGLRAHGEVLPKLLRQQWIGAGGADLQRMGHDVLVFQGRSSIFGKQINITDILSLCCAAGE